jgi:hypothetical protein
MITFFLFIAVLVQSVNSLCLLANVSISGEAFSQQCPGPVSVSYSGDVVIGSNNIVYALDFNYSSGAYSILQGNAADCAYQRAVFNVRY